MKNYSVLFLALFTALFGFAAESPAPDPAARALEVRNLTASLKPQSGKIVIGDGLAVANLPSKLRYLTPKDTETVLTGIWGNPKANHTLGMLVPATFDPLNDESWAVVLTFEEDGYVKDDDAAHIDYAKLLGEMKDNTRDASKERVKQGYAPIELVGWASPPRYDAAAKKLYWAKELKFGDSPNHTLNYNLRLLGRRGVLVLNAVANMAQLKVVEAATPEILSAVNFQDGHRYADYTPGSDKVATYGLAALVAGGVAAKAGLFKGVLVALLALKKFLIIGLIALGAGVKKFWAWLNGRKAASAQATSPFQQP